MNILKVGVLLTTLYCSNCLAEDLEKCERLSELEHELSELSKLYTDHHPEIQIRMREIDNLKQLSPSSPDCRSKYQDEKPV